MRKANLTKTVRSRLHWVSVCLREKARPSLPNSSALPPHSCVLRDVNFSHPNILRSTAQPPNSSIKCQHPKDRTKLSRRANNFRLLPLAFPTSTARHPDLKNPAVPPSLRPTSINLNHCRHSIVLAAPSAFPRPAPPQSCPCLHPHRGLILINHLNNTTVHIVSTSTTSRSVMIRMTHRPLHHRRRCSHLESQCNSICHPPLRMGAGTTFLT